VKFPSSNLRLTLLHSVRSRRIFLRMQASVCRSLAQTFFPPSAASAGHPLISPPFQISHLNLFSPKLSNERKRGFELVLSLLSLPAWGPLHPSKVDSFFRRSCPRLPLVLYTEIRQSFSLLVAKPFLCLKNRLLLFFNSFPFPSFLIAPSFPLV